MGDVNTTENVGAESSNEQERVFSQEEVNKLVGQARLKERSKYPDYDKFKKDALKFKEIEEASKSELEKAKDENAKLEAELSNLKKIQEVAKLKKKIASDFEINADLLRGDSEEELTQHAEALKKAFAGQPVAPVVKRQGETKEVQGSIGERLQEYLSRK